VLFDAELRAITEPICLHLKGKQSCEQGYIHQLRKALKGARDAEFHGSVG